MRKHFFHILLPTLLFVIPRASAAAPPAPLDPRITSNPFLILSHAPADPDLLQWLNHWRDSLAADKEITDDDRKPLPALLQKSPLSAHDLLRLSDYFNDMPKDNHTAVLFCVSSVSHAQRELPILAPDSPDFRSLILDLHKNKLALWKFYGQAGSLPAIKDALLLANQLFIIYLQPSSDPILESIREHGYIGLLEALPPKDAPAFIKNFNPALMTTDETRASYNYSCAYQLIQADRKADTVPYLEQVITYPKFHHYDDALEDLIEAYGLTHQFAKAAPLAKIYRTQYSYLSQIPPLPSYPLTDPLTFPLSDPPSLADKFRKEYPAAEKKIEDAYSHVKIFGHRYSTYYTSETSQNARHELFLFQRSGSATFRYSRSILSEERWPVGAFSIFGGTPNFYFSVYQQPTDPKPIFASFGPPTDYSSTTNYHLHPSSQPYMVNDETLSHELHLINTKILSIKSTTWHDAPAVEIISEFRFPHPTSKTVSTRFYYLDPTTWAVRGSVISSRSDNFYEYNAYEPNPQNSIPRLQYAESWYTNTKDPAVIHQYAISKIISLQFIDLPRSEFSPAILPTFGISNTPAFDQALFDAPDPPPDPIVLPTPADFLPSDQTPDTLAPNAGTNKKSVLPSKDTLNKITAQLDSGEPAQITDALSRIRTLIAGNRVPPDLCYKWLPTLFAKNRYQEVADLALAAVLARPEPRFIDHLLAFRTEALFALSDYDNALQSAKMFYNSSSIAAYPTAMNDLAYAIHFTHPEDPKFVPHFRNQQILAALSDSPAPSALIQSTTIDEKPYAAILARWKQKSDAGQFTDITNYANLLLLLGHPTEAQKIFESLLLTASPEDQTTAQEGIARCLRTQDTSPSRANTYLLNHPAAPPTPDPQIP